MMKSAGEQSAGQAVLHGFSLQYSHRAISAASCASLRNKGLLTVTHPLVRETSTAPAAEREDSRLVRGENRQAGAH